ncbi:1-deoxy-D-xylulose-5-phosphate reductoisomerase [Clostridium felsineum]|uniref:1-deoxy-D-xylulose 5-phosphate reductoisomerase n=1 Tax=Clostridium felsineum TaxID=36839 RepID=A0A1S8L4X5_9CLOT|nr:1-deoxy-D-xylulose-5-phosphate reductoisomerase [Clostridium felsineum]URZ00720.1 1-deoxy-D-xylulose 5-phosphate reductoisomerase [Clostridium felsineum]URZ06641.1 1-deoxy-D-xylulose 5-phosphate reductoisomerase [Clostridium felsineum]URZ11674.1 1-deoxy-D-xylulose 5-phosphate reductoisomerase [Clostridium felsineum]
MKNISILGATGSIGTQTLDVIRHDSESFKLLAISAYRNFEKIIEIINEFKPELVVMIDESAYNKVLEYCKENNITTEVKLGYEALNEVATYNETDIVVTSVVGMIGLIPTLKAIESGKDIALANKETLVVAGEIVTKEAEKYGVNILPVDSEHGAIFQCLQGNKYEDINKILLTASGGPFRGKNFDELNNVTLSDALNHPKWNMGKKITIDSATLMNKGLEVIEAHWLFKVNYEKIQVLVHPQSIVHSMVQYKDGSVIAQLGPTDMRLPIQYALNYPVRKEAIATPIDFFSIPNLHFEKPDMETFKCLKFAYEAGKSGGIMPAVLNSANEYAVDLFLNSKIKFTKIQELIEDALNHFENVNNINAHTIINKSNEVTEYLKGKNIF